MSTSNFNLNAQHHGLNIVEDYEPESFEDVDKELLMDQQGLEGEWEDLTTEEQEDAYEEYVRMFNEYDSSQAYEDTLMNIESKLEANGYSVYEEGEAYLVELNSKTVARYTIHPGYYTGASIDVELLSDEDFVDDLMDDGTLNVDDIVKDIIEEQGLVVEEEDPEDNWVPEDLWDIENNFDTETYEGVKSELYATLATESDKFVLSTIQEFTTQLKYLGSASNGEAFFEYA